MKKHTLWSHLLITDRGNEAIQTVAILAVAATVLIGLLNVGRLVEKRGREKIAAVFSRTDSSDSWSTTGSSSIPPAANAADPSMDAEASMSHIPEEDSTTMPYGPNGTASGIAFSVPSTENPGVTPTDSPAPNAPQTGEPKPGDPVIDPPMTAKPVTPTPGGVDPQDPSDPDPADPEGEDPPSKDPMVKTPTAKAPVGTSPLARKTTPAKTNANTATGESTFPTTAAGDGTNGVASGSQSGSSDAFGAGGTAGSGFPGGTGNQGGFGGTGFQNSGYGNASGYSPYGQNGNGYPNNGYANNGYPNNGYPNNGFPYGSYPGNGKGYNNAGTTPEPKMSAAKKSDNVEAESTINDPKAKSPEQSRTGSSSPAPRSRSWIESTFALLAGNSAEVSGTNVDGDRSADFVEPPAAANDEDNSNQFDGDDMLAPEEDLEPEVRDAEFDEIFVVGVDRTEPMKPRLIVNVDEDFDQIQVRIGKTLLAFKAPLAGSTASIPLTERLLRAGSDIEVIGLLGTTQLVAHYEVPYSIVPEKDMSVAKDESLTSEED